MFLGGGGGGGGSPLLGSLLGGGSSSGSGGTDTTDDFDLDDLEAGDDPGISFATGEDSPTETKDETDDFNRIKRRSRHTRIKNQRN